MRHRMACDVHSMVLGLSLLLDAGEREREGRIGRGGRGEGECVSYNRCLFSNHCNIWSSVHSKMITSSLHHHH